MEKQENKGFFFYESFCRGVEALPDNVSKFSLLRAIMYYGIYGQEPQFTEVEEWQRPFLNSAFVQIRILLDGAKARYNANVTNGKKGGRPRKATTEPSESKREPRQTTSPTESKQEQPRAQEQPPSEAKPVTPTPPPPTTASTPSRAQGINERMAQFVREVAEYREKYTDSLLNAFASYWSEPNQAKTKMRFEMEKTWDTGRRLATWAKRDNEYNRGTETHMQRQERERAERMQSVKELIHRLSLEDGGDEIQPY